MVKNNINKVQTMFLKNSDISGQMGRTKMLRTAAYTGVASMAVYVLCFICPPVHDNDSHAITGTSVASDTTLSISLSGSELPLDLTPTSSNGTFVSTADDDTKASTAVIHVATNNITGYTLGIKASNPVSSSADKLISNNEKCENTPTSNKCAISSLSQPVSSEDYIDNTVEGIDLNNTWGYAPSYYNSTPNTTTTTTLDPNTNENITTTSPINYYPAPVNGDTIAATDAPNQENTTTNDGALLEDEYTIDYGMRIDYTPYTGTYSTNYNNQSYIITAVGNLVPYSVSYNANKPEQAQVDTTVDNMPTAQAGNVQGGDTVAVILSTKVPTLGSTNPSTGEYEYAGYVFNGWCTVQPGEDQATGYQICPNDATFYQPGDNFGIDQTAENTQILYATWGAPAAVVFNSNGLVYNDTPTVTENTMTYIPTYTDGKVTSDKVNVVDSGIYRAPILPTPDNYIFKGWSADQNATEATYADEQAIINDLTLNAYDDVTLYAIWAYTTVITFDGNGADSGTMGQFTIEAGKTDALPQNTFTKTNYYFAGWNTEEDESGDSYKNQSDFTAPAGSNNVTLYTQWTDCAPNSICYKPNGANEAENDPKMGTQIRNYDMNYNNITSGMEVNLWSMNYRYDTNNDGYNDYGFAGWSEDRNAASKILDVDPDNDPTIYGPNQTITLGDVSTAGLKLYAVWMPVTKSDTATDLTFQTTNLLTTTLADGTTLASKPNGYVTALKDQRDNQVYAVAKLADGTYWMIENLRLDDSAVLDNTNTNNPANGFTALTSSSDSWCEQDRQSSCVDQSKLNTSNVTQPAMEMIYPHNNAILNGNYYNWYAATAGNGTYSRYYGTIAGDICPAGWRLPRGGHWYSTPGTFSNLNEMINDDAYVTDATSSRAWRSFPNNFIYSGSWRGSKVKDRSGEGYYLSFDVGNNQSAIALYLSNTRVDPSVGGIYKIYGGSVRCVVPSQ